MTRSMTPKTLPHPAEVQPVGVQGDTPKTYLTLSAVGELGPDDCGSVAVIEDLLEGIELAADPSLAQVLTDRLIDYVWPPAYTEAENRLMWGDR